MKIAVVAVLAVVSLGCATAPRVDVRCDAAYEPLDVASDVAHARLLEAAANTLRAQGFSELIFSNDGRRVIGASPEHDGMRDRAKVEVVDGHLRVDVRTELRDGVADWIRSDEVCAGYRYVRENALAQEILRGAQASNLTALR